MEIKTEPNFTEEPVTDIEVELVGGKSIGWTLYAKDTFETTDISTLSVKTAMGEWTIIRSNVCLYHVRERMHRTYHEPVAPPEVQ